jgi:methionine synthase I (cobalamin-dependent)
LDLKEKLDGGILFNDGAAGTLLADHGIDQPHNRANLPRAHAVRAYPMPYPAGGVVAAVC